MTCPTSWIGAGTTIWKIATGRVLPAYQLRMDDVGLGDKLREIVFRGKGFLDPCSQVRKG